MPGQRQGWNSRQNIRVHCFGKLLAVVYVRELQSKRGQPRGRLPQIEASCSGESQRLWRYHPLIVVLQAFKAVFTSPSSAKEADGDGDGADILENNRRARQKSDQPKVKTCVASIINMKKVTPRAIAYIVCQVSRKHLLF